MTNMLMVPQNLAPNIRAVRDRIRTAASRLPGRSVDSVTLLAVSKTHPADLIRAAAQEGLEHFGESYLQEALPKIETLRGLELTWHFIGSARRGTRPSRWRRPFTWVHGVDRLRIAQRLSDQRPFHAPPLNVCLQVNIGGELTKGGVEPRELARSSHGRWPPYPGSPCADSCAFPRRRAIPNASATGSGRPHACCADAARTGHDARYLIHGNERRSGNRHPGRRHHSARRHGIIRCATEACR